VTAGRLALIRGNCRLGHMHAGSRVHRIVVLAVRCLCSASKTCRGSKAPPGQQQLRTEAMVGDYVGWRDEIEHDHSGLLLCTRRRVLICTAGPC